MAEGKPLDPGLRSSIASLSGGKVRPPVGPAEGEFEDTSCGCGEAAEEGFRSEESIDILGDFRPLGGGAVVSTVGGARWVGAE